MSTMNAHSPSTHKALNKARRDPSPWVQVAAKIALQRIKNAKRTTTPGQKKPTHTPRKQKPQPRPSRRSDAKIVLWSSDAKYFRGEGRL